MRYILLYMTLIIIFGGNINTAIASPWPYYSFKIARCKGGPQGPCSKLVYYTDAQTFWREIPEMSKSTLHTVKISMVGIHCSKGRKEEHFFRECSLMPSESDKIHSPGMIGKCETTEPDNFILKNPTNCAGNTSFYSATEHYGAAPGAECAIIGKLPEEGGTPSYIDTPYGKLTAEQIANSRDTYCLKASAPALDCNVSLSNGGILDHNIQSPTSVSERQLDIEIDCGDNINLSLVDEIIKLDNNRIISSLTIIPNGTKYLLKSTLKTNKAKAGSYSGSTILVVSPQ